MQVLGAVAAAGKPGFDVVTSVLARNGYGAHSPGGYSLGACLVTEFVMTYFYSACSIGKLDLTFSSTS